MRTVCRKNQCAGCKECISICTKGAIKIIDSVKYYNAIIDENKCIGCNLCIEHCQNNHIIPLIKPMGWYQGWAKDAKLRSNSSSGGYAASIEYNFIISGGYVCSCVFEHGTFSFKLTNNVLDIPKFSGSKYVKSAPGDIYKKIFSLIKTKNKVLFVGLPCQVAAIKDYVGDQNQKLLYTIDLVCHGSPSPRLLNDFLKEKNITLSNLENISFREKNTFCVKTNGNLCSTFGMVDRYSLGFLCFIFNTENCYNCKYADIRRIGDLTLGDSWGSELPINEQKKGISLALYQTPKGKELLENSNLTLLSVNLQNAILNNQQLREPCKRTNKWEKFFYLYDGKFNKRVFQCLKWKCIKQEIKRILANLQIFF